MLSIHTHGRAGDGRLPGGESIVALATSLTTLTPGDNALLTALREKGADARPAIWSDRNEDWRVYDAVVIRSCWDYHLRAAEFLDWLDGLQCPVINAPDLIRWNSDKKYLAELSAAGIAIPPTIFVDGGTLDLATTGWPESVVKPRVSASAHGTSRRTTGVVTGPSIVQKFMTAVETAGEWSLIYLGGEFSHVVIKRPRPGDFRVQEEFGGMITPADPPTEAIAFTQRVLRAVPPATYARVDVIVDGGSLYLMELELIEPELYLDLAPGSAARLAECIRRDMMRH